MLISIVITIRTSFPPCFAGVRHPHGLLCYNYPVVQFGSLLSMIAHARSCGSPLPSPELTDQGASACTSHRSAMGCRPRPLRWHGSSPQRLVIGRVPTQRNHTTAAAQCCTADPQSQKTEILKPMAAFEHLSFSKAGLEKNRQRPVMAGRAFFSRRI